MDLGWPLSVLVENYTGHFLSCRLGILMADAWDTFHWDDPLAALAFALPEGSQS